MCRRSRVARRWQIARSVGGGPSAAASQDYFPQGSVAFVRTYSSVRKVQIRTAANLCNKLYCSAHAEKLVYTGEQEQRLHLRNVLSCISSAYRKPQRMHPPGDGHHWAHARGVRANDSR